MAKLATVVDKVEDLDEGVRQFYVAREDGKYQLDSDGIADTQKLNNALKRERDQKEAERKVRSELEQRYKDIDVDEYQRLKAAAQKDGAPAADQIEKLISKRVDEVKREF